MTLLGDVKMNDKVSLQKPLSTTLTRVGIVLVVVGLLDICYMVYCIVHRLSYHSSLNIFAVIAGIYLIRGNLRATGVITWFAAFMLAGVIGGLVLLVPFFLPMRLLLTEFSLNPVSMSLSFGLSVVMLLIIAWVYRSLRSPIVLQARSEAGLNGRSPITAVLAGIAIVVIIAVVMRAFMNSDAAKQARNIALKMDGPDYSYVIQSMNITNGHVSALITAYNKTEIKTVQVYFQEN